MEASYFWKALKLFFPCQNPILWIQCQVLNESLIVKARLLAPDVLIVFNDHCSLRLNWKGLGEAGRWERNKFCSAGKLVPQQQSCILPTPTAFMLRCVYIPAVFTVAIPLLWPVLPSFFPRLCLTLRMVVIDSVQAHHVAGHCVILLHLVCAFCCVAHKNPCEGVT